MTLSANPSGRELAAFADCLRALAASFGPDGHPDVIDAADKVSELADKAFGREAREAIAEAKAAERAAKIGVIRALKPGDRFQWTTPDGQLMPGWCEVLTGASETMLGWLRYRRWDDQVERWSVQGLADVAHNFQYCVFAAEPAEATEVNTCEAPCEVAGPAKGGYSAAPDFLPGQGKKGRPKHPGFLTITSDADEFTTAVPFGPDGTVRLGYRR